MACRHVQGLPGVPPLDYQTSHLSAVMTHRGLMRPVRMPFGIKACPEIFQKHIETVFRERIVEDDIIIYIDDFFGYGETVDEAVDKLCRVLEVAIRDDLRLNLSKFEFGQDVKFLGVGVGPYDMYIAADNLEAIRNLPIPSNMDELRDALSLLGWFKNHIPFFSDLSAPFAALRQKGATWSIWTSDKERYEAAFLKLQQATLARFSLAFPAWRYPFSVFVSASFPVVYAPRTNKSIHPAEFRSAMTVGAS